MSGNFKPPVEVDQVIDLTIEQIGSKGDGIGRINGYVIFVPDTEAGKTYKVKITNTRDRCGFGEIVA
jgi:predicted RNA-binding protein with TRAM domain